MLDLWGPAAAVSFRVDVDGTPSDDALDDRRPSGGDERRNRGALDEFMGVIRRPVRCRLAIGENQIGALELLEKLVPPDFDDAGSRRAQLEQQRPGTVLIKRPRRTRGPAPRPGLDEVMIDGQAQRYRHVVYPRLGEDALNDNRYRLKWFDRREPETAGRAFAALIHVRHARACHRKSGFPDLRRYLTCETRASPSFDGIPTGTHGACLSGMAGT